jgi:hypothetical protein
MLNLLKRMRIVKLRVVADPSMSHADLQIHSLLDDPNLRRAMGLDDGDEQDAIALEAVEIA